MKEKMVSTAQNVILRESGLEEVKIVDAEASDGGAVYTLGREYMKPVREFVEGNKAEGNGVVFMCPKQNKKQAAFLASQAYMLMEKGGTLAEEDLDETDDFEWDDYFSTDDGDEEEDGEMPKNPQRDLLVIEYAALFEKAKDSGNEMVIMQKQQLFQKLSEKYQNALFICEGNLDIDHFLYIYRTIHMKNKAICFYGQIDEFLVKRVTFELKTNRKQLLTLKKPTNQEYLVMLQQYIEENGYPAKKIAAPLLKRLMNYRKDFFTEQDIYDHVGMALQQKKTAGALDLSDFAFAFSEKKEKTAEEELEELIGLEGVKEQVKRTVVSQVISESSGIPVYGHMIFAGRPGTAKTTCARLYNSILAEHSLSNGRFIEAGRADIIGSYLGETAPKVKRLFERGDGGVIFIDEAGFLKRTEGREDLYVREAVTELVRNLENNPQTRVIFATYPEYAKDLLDADPGFASRLKVLQFPSYSKKELLEILYKMLKDRKAVIEESQKTAVEEEVLSYLGPMMDQDNFGNGREVRKLIETVLEEYGMDLFYGNSNKKFLMEESEEMTKLPGKKGKIILTAEHFKRAAAHIKDSKEALEKEKKQHRPIGFAMPVREGMKV